MLGQHVILIDKLLNVEAQSRDTHNAKLTDNLLFLLQTWQSHVYHTVSFSHHVKLKQIRKHKNFTHIRLFPQSRYRKRLQQVSSAQQSDGWQRWSVSLKESIVHLIVTNVNGRCTRTQQTLHYATGYIGTQCSSKLTVFLHSLLLNFRLRKIETSCSFDAMLFDNEDLKISLCRRNILTVSVHCFCSDSHRSNL